MFTEVEAQNRPIPIIPIINVTPLIDVMLVLLIIFMVTVPRMPSRFLARLPSEPQLDFPAIPDDLTLVVTINPDRTLKLNSFDVGSVDDASKLSATLVKLFAKRKTNHAYSYEMSLRTDVPDEYRVQRTVFIKAPRSLGYGEVAIVIDAIKGAGADPVGLQLDNLN